MKTLKGKLRDIKRESNSKLKRAVITDLLSYSNDSDDIQSHMEDILQYGCQSGAVGMLIYYSDTKAFFKKYKKDIMDLLKETLEMTGFKTPQELFGDKFDSDDYFMEETQNQNLMSWFGYEETVRQLFDDLEIEW